MINFNITDYESKISEETFEPLVKVIDAWIPLGAWELKYLVGDKEFVKIARVEFGDEVADHIRDYML